MTTAIAHFPISPVEDIDADDDGLFEIVDGKRVEKQMSSLACKTAGIVSRELGNFLKTSGVGDLYIEQSYKCFPHAPGQIRRPDISIITADRTAEVPDEGHTPVSPDLAIEIVSPNDKVYELDDKLEDYAAVGVKLVWVINPHSRIVRVHGPGQAHAVFGEADTLTGQTVLPGFSILVKNLFPPPKTVSSSAETRGQA